MKWSTQERAAFYELWGEEPPPSGWNLVWERMSHLLGEERRLRRVDAVVVGGDPVVTALLLRAQSRHAPSAHVVWDAPSFWGATAYPWLVHPETVERLSDLLRRPAAPDLPGLLAGIRAEALATLEVRGGTWSRALGPVRCAAVPSGGYVWVVDPPSTEPVVSVHRGPVEARLVALHDQSCRAYPVWPVRPAVMMGGCAARVVVAGSDKWKESLCKDVCVEDFALPYPGNGSISLARSLWWERIEALVRSPSFV